jgi:hypothetical protein
LSVLRVRRCDAAEGARSWHGTPTFGWINPEVGAAVAPVRRRASYFARNKRWVNIVSNTVASIDSGAFGADIVPQSQYPDAGPRAALQQA